MTEKSYTIDEIKELLKVGLISVPDDNSLAPKSKIHYPSDKNNNQGGLCMEGKIVYINGWRIDFRRKQIGGYISYDELGRPFPTHEWAEQYLNKIRAEVTNGTFKIDRYQKAGSKEWLFENKYEEWLSIGCDKKETEWSPSYKVKVEQYQKYFYSFFGGMDLRIINTNHVRQFYHSKPLKHLSPKTKKNIIGVLKSFYGRCLNLNNIDFPSPKVGEKIIRWIDENEQLSIMKHIPDIHKPIFWFLLLTGCRPSEARALQRWDIDFKKNTITIRHNFSHRKFREMTKGKKERIIPIHSQLLPILKSLPRYPNISFVFLNPKNRQGMYYGENGLTDIWNKAVEKAGYGYVKLYNGTRHSFASQLLKEGAHIGDIQELLGHSSIDQTKIYAHSEQTRLTKVIELKGRQKSNLLHRVAPVK